MSNNPSTAPKMGMEACAKSHGGGMALALASKLINVISEEMGKPEVQAMIKGRIVVPFINIMYTEMYPYIITFVVTITLILVLSLLTFLCFVVYYFKK